MRYFLISYAYAMPDASFGFGDIPIGHPAFPSRIQIMKLINDDDIQASCIIGIYEFKNEKDYNSFTKK